MPDHKRRATSETDDKWQQECVHIYTNCLFCVHVFECMYWKCTSCIAFLVFRWMHMFFFIYYLRRTKMCILSTSVKCTTYLKRRKTNLTVVALTQRCHICRHTQYKPTHRTVSTTLDFPVKLHVSLGNFFSFIISESRIR